MELEKRLRWRCRRGTRELDLLLERFLGAAGPSLDLATQGDLDRLLASPDQDLLDWIWRRAPVPDARLEALVELSRQPQE